MATGKKNKKAVTRAATETVPPHSDSEATGSIAPLAVTSIGEREALAYQRCEEDIDALDAALIGRITTDVPAAAMRAMGAVAAIKSLLPQMHETFVHPPVAEVEGLEDPAFALLFTHARFSPDAVVSDMEAELEEARVLRDLMLVTAEAHVAHGKMSASRLGRIREGQGYADRATDLVSLSALFDDAWPSIENRTEITRAQVNRALELGRKLAKALGTKAVGGESLVESLAWADRRARAFRLLVIDYELIRAAIAFMRLREGDMEKFAPTLFPRGRVTRLDEEEEESSVPGSGPETPPASPALPSTTTPTPAKPTGNSS